VITYVDGSVVLRIVLGQNDTLAQWNQVEEAISSAVVRVEAFRTLDRLRLRRVMSDAELAGRFDNLLKLLARFRLIVTTPDILLRAEQPMPTVLGTLDAIHLATALLWREVERKEIVMATHDRELAIAARAHGMSVIGVQL
jgi:predicted nucleic acid-binding protein